MKSADPIPATTSSPASTSRLIRARGWRPWGHYALLLIPAIAIALLQCRAVKGVDSFGFTPDYLSLAQTTMEHHAYVDRLGDKIVPAVEREPLYPFALVEAHRLWGNFDALLGVQCAALMLTYFLWGVMALRQTGAAVGSTLARCPGASEADRDVQQSESAVDQSSTETGPRPNPPPEFQARGQEVRSASQGFARTAASTWSGWIAVAVLYALLLADPQPGFYASVLYPFAFQMLLVTLAVFFLAAAMRSAARRHVEPNARSVSEQPSAPQVHARHSPAARPAASRWTVAALIVSGIFAGLAPYERGAYLALPLFMALALLVVRRRIPLGLKHILLFLVPALIVPFPWLVRNRMLGAGGMNQMSGYTLGFTYGDLRPQPRDDFERAYEASIKEHKSTDAGTFDFIRQQAASGAMTYAQADGRVARYVLHKMRAHPAGVWKQVRNSLACFPCALCGPTFAHLSGVEIHPRQRWHAFASRRPAGASDLIVFALALAGLALMALRPETRPLAAVFAAVLLYTLLFSTLIVKFDPRYRGVIEPMLFLAAAYGVARVIGWIAGRMQSRGGVAT